MSNLVVAFKNSKYFNGFDMIKLPDEFKGEIKRFNNSLLFDVMRFSISFEYSSCPNILLILLFSTMSIFKSSLLFSSSDLSTTFNIVYLLF